MDASTDDDTKRKWFLLFLCSLLNDNLMYSLLSECRTTEIAKPHTKILFSKTADADILNVFQWKS